MPLRRTLLMSAVGTSLPSPGGRGVRGPAPLPAPLLLGGQSRPAREPHGPPPPAGLARLLLLPLLLLPLLLLIVTSPAVGSTALLPRGHLLRRSSLLSPLLLLLLLRRHGGKVLVGEADGRLAARPGYCGARGGRVRAPVVEGERTVFLQSLLAAHHAHGPRGDGREAVHRGRIGILVLQIVLVGARVLLDMIFFFFFGVLAVAFVLVFLAFVLVLVLVVR
mmetsp:Transcript_56125/g.167998  ORF Transcript_56125/g.167998 Transcript_56125/m.167998 type:complete len:221 (-) Transcript_56125:141-803(-)